MDRVDRAPSVERGSTVGVYFTAVAGVGPTPCPLGRVERQSRWRGVARRRAELKWTACRPYYSCLYKQTTGRKHYDHGYQAAPPGTRLSPSFSILVNHGCRVLVWAGAGAGGTREQARRPNARQTTLSSGASARGGGAQLSALVAQLGESVAQHLQPQVSTREDALGVELHGRHRQAHVLHGHDDAVRLVSGRQVRSRQVRGRQVRSRQVRGRQVRSQVGE